MMTSHGAASLISQVLRRVSTSRQPSSNVQRRAIPGRARKGVHWPDSTALSSLDTLVTFRLMRFSKDVFNCSRMSLMSSPQIVKFTEPRRALDVASTRLARRRQGRLVS